MKKVGIITIIDFGNLGNRLQNYAVQEFLKKQGMDPYTILRDTRYPRNNIKWKLKNIFFMIYERCRIFRNCTINKKLIWHKMYKFTKKNINLSPYVIQGNQVPEKIDKEYEDKDIKWRIFLADEENIFLIASDYIAYDNIPATKLGNKLEHGRSSYPRSIDLSSIVED